MLKLPMIFADHMVLQRQKPIAVWGLADAGATVRASLARGDSILAEETAVVCEDGSWRMELEKQEAARGLTLIIACGEETAAFSDVLVGEVWIAGGQSNMEYWLYFDADRQAELDKPENPEIRFFDYPEISFEGELEQYDFSDFGFWRQCRSDELPWFSAVGYYFALKVQAALGVPVGIVGCNWGGSRACCWMPESYLRGTPGEIWLREYADQLSGMDQAEYIRCYLADPASIQNHPVPGDFPKMLFPGLTREEQLALLAQPQQNPYAGIVGPLHPWRPCGLYETMLTKVAPYTSRGVIWYQGESDSAHPDVYDVVMERMIRCWRDLWGDELPFLMVQLAPFGVWMDCDGTGYPAVRAMQQKVSETVPGVCLCSSSDAGMRWDIHPKHKKPIGERLALLARGHVYGEDILCDAPKLRGVRLEGRQAVVEFDHAEGLHVRGGSVNALCVNGAPCAARAAGNCLRVDLPDAESWRIELAYTDYYEVNLYNAAGIPAMPFEVCVTKQGQ